MRIDSVFLLFSLALITLAGVHQLAMSWYLYWAYPWFDMPMHFLGGIIIGLGSQTELFEKTMRVRIPTVWVCAALVLAVGLLWEVFEWMFVIVNLEGYVLDTARDLVLDLAGGSVGYVIASSFRKYLPF